jgi:peptide/nickel transport system permease protein
VLLKPVPVHRRILGSPMLMVGLVILALVVLAAVFAPWLTSYNPRAITGPPLQTPSARHLLGTNVPGEDIYAELLYGTRTSLVAGVLGGLLAMLGAILLGVLPVLFSPLADTISNRVTIFLLAMPAIPLLIVIGSLAGNNQFILIFAIGFGGVAYNARLLRSQALTLRDRGFISAARGFGGGPTYVLRRHIVPAMGPLVIIGFVNWASISVLVQASLAFLGLGDPTGVSWGLMMNRALAQPGIYLSRMWTWWVLPPGIALTLTLLGFTFVGVALEPVFNPRWHRSS